MEIDQEEQDEEADKLEIVDIDTKKIRRQAIPADTALRKRKWNLELKYSLVSDPQYSKEVEQE